MGWVEGLLFDKGFRFTTPTGMGGGGGETCKTCPPNRYIGFVPYHGIEAL